MLLFFILYYFTLYYNLILYLFIYACLRYSSILAYISIHAHTCIDLHKHWHVHSTLPPDTPVRATDVSCSKMSTNPASLELVGRKIILSGWEMPELNGIYSWGNHQTI
jgi:hypothetical protein